MIRGIICSEPSDIESRYQAHEGSVTCVAFGPNKLVATAGPDGCIKLWDLASSKKEKGSIRAIRSPPSCISFSTSGHAMAVATTNNKDNYNVKILSTNKKGLPGKTTLEGHLEMVNSVTFTRNSNNVVSASQDKTVRIWDLQTGKDKRLPLVTSFANSVDVNSSDSLCVVGFNSGALKTWNMHDKAIASKFDTMHDFAVTCVKFLPGDDKVASMSKDNTIKVTDLRMLKTLFTLEDMNLCIKG